MIESWQLKICRSYEHFEDVKRRVESLNDPSNHPARIEKQFSQNRWRYTLRCGAAIDEMLPVVVGDMLFNLRSALDHIAVANVPFARQRQAQFPIFTKPIWDENTDGTYVHPDNAARENWNRQTFGMNPAVLKIIEWAQPYNARRREESTDPAHDALSLLSTFQNADKHRELSVLVTGLTDVTAWNSADEIPFEFGATHDGFLKDGAQFLSSPTDVNVQVRGTIEVALTRGGSNAAHYRLLEVLEQIHMDVVILVGAIEQEM